MKTIAFETKNDFEERVLLECFEVAEKYFEKAADMAQSRDEFGIELDSIDLAKKWKEHVEKEIDYTPMFNIDLPTE
jgi:hypothetical protein